MEDHESDEAKRWAIEYAKRAGVTVEWLRDHGQEVSRCDCGEDICEGWQMAHVREDAFIAGEIARHAD